MADRVLEDVACILKLPLEDAVRKKLQSSTKLNVVVLGCYQVGKSTLINAMFFEKDKEYIERAEEGSKMQPCTPNVCPHTLVMKDDDVEVFINIFDSPGLQDGSHDDREYLQKIKDRCSKVHLIIYCTKMEEPIRPAEKMALSSITSAFGEAIWENVVIALTFANKVEPASPTKDEKEHFHEIISTKKGAMQECFKEIGHEQVFTKGLAKRVYPVGSARRLELATGENWQAEFWKGCLYACQPEGQGALLKFAWRNLHFLKVVGASVGTTSGGVTMVAGVGSAIAGGVLTATGILAPLGVPLIAAGVAASLLGFGATVGGATGIKIAREKERNT